MGQKAITIYTPEGTAAHITAEDDAFIHRIMLGADSGILGGLTCARVDDNTVRLSGGGVSNRGYILWIPDGETLELSIDSGVTGYSRIDTVVSEFVKGNGDIADVHTLKIVKGMATAGTPAPPSLTTSNLLNTGNVNQLALFYVRIVGAEITGITRAAGILPQVSGSSPTLYIQQAQPSSPQTGDLWFW